MNDKLELQLVIAELSQGGNVCMMIKLYADLLEGDLRSLEKIEGKIQVPLKYRDSVKQELINRGFIVQ